MAVKIENVTARPIVLPDPVDATIPPHSVRTFDYIAYDDVTNREAISRLIGRQIRVINLDEVNRFVLPYENSLVVSPSGSNFTSVKEAVDSIIDASATNRYVVQVFPGIYDEAPFSMKPFVSVVGTGTFTGGAAVIRTTNDSAHFITGAENSTLKSVVIEGPANAGFGAIHHSSVSSLPFFVDRVVIRKGYYGICSDSTGGSSVLNAFLCSFEYAGNTINQFFRCVNEAVLIATNCSVASVISGSVDIGLYVSGASSKATITNCFFGSTAPFIGIEVEDQGTFISSGTTFDRGTTAIFVTPTSGAASVMCLGSNIHSGFTNAIDIDSATSSIQFSGFADKNKISVAAGATFSAVFTDETPTEEGQVVFGELWLGSSDNSVPLATLTRSTSSTGLVSGGGLSRGGGRVVNVAAGSGFIDTSTSVLKIDWSADTATIPASSTREIFVDTDGIVQIGTTEDYDNTILLGDAVADASSIIFLKDHFVDLVQPRPKHHQYTRDVVGPIHVAGLATTKNGAPSLQLDVDSGTYYTRDNLNSATGAAPITFRYWYRDGSGGWTTVASQTAIDPENYDDGSGTLAAIPGGNYKKDLLFTAQNSGGTEFHVVYGQETFASQVAAETGNNPTPFSEFTIDSLRLAGIVVLKSANDIASLVDERPRLGQLASGSTSITDHGLLSGLADDDHTQYQLRSEKGLANGYAALDAGTQIPAGQHGTQTVSTLHALTSSSGAGFQPQSNFSAVVDPTASDDGVAGYQIGSKWVNTSTDQAFVCVDNTTGLAVWEIAAVKDDFAEATGTINTSSTTDVLATGMTLTPPAGTYFVMFTGSGNSAGATIVFTSVYAGGVQVPSSERTTTGSFSFMCPARVVVNGSQAIEGRWRVNSGTGSMNNRSIWILRVD